MLGMILLLAACTSISLPFTVTALPATATPTASLAEDAVDPLVEHFRASVVDASVAEPDEIYDGMVAITPDNELLTWDEDQSHVLMVTWTSWDGYDSEVGNEIVLQREIWVTVAPELQTFCQSYEATEPPLILRMEQLLGLPPDDGKTRMVEMWVPVDGLFRPSPDPEIDDQVAELELRDPSAFESQEAYEFHRDWYNLQVSLSYDAMNGYPWTRLGYTYDWGNPESEVGLSEFVIWAQTSVIVDEVYSNEEYCS